VGIPGGGAQEHNKRNKRKEGKGRPRELSDRRPQASEVSFFKGTEATVAYLLHWGHWYYDGIMTPVLVLECLYLQ